MSIAKKHSRDVKHFSSLRAFFEPSSIAVIGASETDGSVGKTLTLNLVLSEFKGKSVLVNPKCEKSIEHKAYPSLKDVKETIDLAFIAAPAKTVASLVRECGECGIKAVIVISAG